MTLTDDNLLKPFSAGTVVPLPQLSVILPTKDRTPILFRTLDALLESTAAVHCEIFIIDNSTVADIALPENLKQQNVTVLKNPGNRNSVFSSRNYGASLAKSELLLFLDDDILVNRESIDFVLDFHGKNERVAANVSWEYPLELLGQLKETYFGRFLIRAGFTTMRELYGVDRWKANAVFESGEVASYFLSVKKKDFWDSGGYDERHLHEGTDINLMENFRAHHIKMFINSAIKVFHNEEDRVEMRNWLERKKRFGEISAHAVSIGKSDGHALNYSPFKSILLQLAYGLRAPLLIFVKYFPQRIRFLDKFMFWIISGLTGAFIHRGYSRGMQQHTGKNP